MMTKGANTASQPTHLKRLDRVWYVPMVPLPVLRPMASSAIMMLKPTKTASSR